MLLTLRDVTERGCKANLDDIVISRTHLREIIRVLLARMRVGVGVGKMTP